MKHVKREADSESFSITDDETLSHCYSDTPPYYLPRSALIQAVRCLAGTLISNQPGKRPGPKVITSRSEAIVKAFDSWLSKEVKKHRNKPTNKNVLPLPYETMISHTVAPDKANGMNEPFQFDVVQSEKSYDLVEVYASVMRENRFVCVGWVSLVTHPYVEGCIQTGDICVWNDNRHLEKKGWFSPAPSSASNETSGFVTMALLAGFVLGASHSNASDFAANDFNGGDSGGSESGGGHSSDDGYDGGSYSGDGDYGGGFGGGDFGGGGGGW